jgi:hypothetical protein
MVVGQLLHQLWRHIQWRTLDRSQYDRVGRHAPSKAKIAQFNDTVGRDENILRLHVSVDDPVTVQVVQGVYQLLGDFAHFRLTEVSIVFEDLEQLTLGEFRHNAEFM